MTQEELLEVIQKAIRTGSTALNLSNKGLTTLPPEICRWIGLTELDLTGNSLTSLPAEIVQLTRLMVLRISNNGLTTLPPEITQLKNLRVLHIDNNRLTTLPPEIVQLTKLTKLAFHYNQLTTFPAEIVKFNNLSVLYLSNNQLTSLPKEIVQLTNLMVLYIDNNRLTTLPTSIGQLAKLTQLSIERNKLTVLPAEIGQLTSLTKIGISKNGLTNFPHEIVKLTNLTMLYADDNGLTTLPPEIGQLIKLAKLHVNNNGLTTLPDEIGQLVKLRELYLSSNRLTALPGEISQLTNLEKLDLQNNPLPLLPEVLKRVDDPVGLIALYLQQSQEATRPLGEAKMLLVGQGFAGKTSLRRALMEEEVNPKQLKTDGIERNRWLLRIHKEKIVVNIWDFGGQEIMHSTHQFFLTERSLYLLVLNARQDERENRLEYWLKLIQTFGGNAPILVVINKSEEHPLSLDESGLRRKYPNIQGFYRTSACPEKGPAQGIEELSEAIHQEIDGLENLRKPLPGSCFTVKQSLENMSQDFISVEEFQALCHEKKVPAELQNILLELLHDLGTALNYRQHSRFDLADTSILNPEWVTSGVYRILNHLHTVWEKQAILPVAKLPELLSLAQYPGKKYPFLLGMMEQFEICYCMDGEKRSEFLLPDLLPPTEPDTGDWHDKLMFEYHYDVWIPSIMTRFIVRMAPHISQNTVWKKGVLLRYDGMRALVKVDPEEKQLAIWVEGPTARRREMLAIIRREFEVIHKSFEDLRFEEKVPIPDNPGSYVSYRHLLNLEEDGETGYIPEGMRKRIAIRELLDGIVSPLKREQERVQIEQEARKVITPKTTFEYDVFLSHSSKDKAVVRKLAEQLRKDGLRVWLDEWVIQLGDNIAVKIEHGLAEARVLLLFMSENFFASDWVTLERHTSLFRDPINKQRRFIPLLLEDCEIPDMLRQFSYLDWRDPDDEAYERLVKACKTP